MDQKIVEQIARSKALALLSENTAFLVGENLPRRVEVIPCATVGETCSFEVVPPDKSHGFALSFVVGCSVAALPDDARRDSEFHPPVAYKEKAIRKIAEAISRDGFLFELFRQCAAELLDEEERENR